MSLREMGVILTKHFLTEVMILFTANGVSSASSILLVQVVKEVLINQESDSVVMRLFLKHSTTLNVH